MQTHRLSMNDPAGSGVFALIATALMPAPPQSAPSQRHAPDRDLSVKASAPRRGLLERLDRWFWAQQQREIEAYLAKATDLFDLEARIRAIDRNGFRPHY